MDRKYFLIILSATLIALVIALYAPGGRQADTDPKLPWLISIDDVGQLTVFHVTLEKTTLSEARDIFRSQGKMNLFTSPKGEYAVEVFFQRLFLSGLKADLVLTLMVDQATLNGMFERGLRISKLGSGAQKVTLTDDDVASLTTAPISSIAFIPATDLEESLIESRFGTPDQRITEESDSDIVHWLYPDKGLDIAVNAEAKEVFQYIPPAKFSQLTAPLSQ